MGLIWPDTGSMRRNWYNSTNDAQNISGWYHSLISYVHNKEQRTPSIHSDWHWNFLSLTQIPQWCIAESESNTENFYAYSHGYTCLLTYRYINNDDTCTYTYLYLYTNLILSVRWDNHLVHFIPISLSFIHVNFIFLFKIVWKIYVLCPRCMSFIELASFFGWDVGGWPI